MSKYKILVIDDELDITDSITDYFSDHNIKAFNDPELALDCLAGEFHDILICDFKMPKLSGLELLFEAYRLKSYSYGILLTAFADKDLLEKVLNEKLVNKVIEKPLNLKALSSVLEESFKKKKKKENEKKDIERIKTCYNNLKMEIESRNKIIGLNKGLKEVYEKVLTAAPLNVDILLTGETGTGKELIAQLIHDLSPRKEYEFIKINCAAIPENLLESELFGYKKGAFSGAIMDKAGKIECADKGTLFLDEIGELQLDLQAKILRVIQDKEVVRLGTHKSVKVDFRLIAATNRELDSEVLNKNFREDLFYRINSFPLHLPPLRERTEDINDLVDFFIERICNEMNLHKLKIDQSLYHFFKTYSWPGNIRNLENSLKRAIILAAAKGKLEKSDFDFLLLENKQQLKSLETAYKIIGNSVINNECDLKDIHNFVIVEILKHFNDNVKEAVKKTGISKDKFYRGKNSISNIK
ncbi:MAG: sigma-54 dependent transcriptional regulator [Spirochaetes bacterium]|nr:sigma-54 dependent transcriptional regulator [Spirochaetota bacterium]